MKLETVKMTIGVNTGTIRLNNQAGQTIGSLNIRRQRVTHFVHDVDLETLAEQVVRAQGGAEEQQVARLMGVLERLSQEAQLVMNELRDVS